MAVALKPWLKHAGLGHDQLESGLAATSVLGLEAMPDPMCAGLATRAGGLRLELCTIPADIDCKRDAQSLQLELCTIPTDKHGKHDDALSLQSWALSTTSE